MTKVAAAAAKALGAGTFGAWLVLTALNQSRRTRDVVRPLDPLGLVTPLWTFFGPTPGTNDTMLLYRTGPDPELDTDWRIANTMTPRRLLHLVHAPHRRAEKSLLDLSQVIGQAIREDITVDKLQHSAGYIMLLQAVSHLADRNGERGYLQFCLVDSPGYGIGRRAPQPVFFSRTHRLEGAATT